MTLSIKINSRIKLESFNNDSLTFMVDEDRTATFHTQTPEIHIFLLTFVTEGKSIDELQSYGSSNSSQSRVFMFIDNLKKNGLLDYHFEFESFEMAIVSPKHHSFRDIFLEQPNFLTKACPYILSRFAYIRTEHGKMIIECPLAPFCLTLNSEMFNRLLPFINGEKKLTDYYRNEKEEKTWRVFSNLLIEFGFIHPLNETETEYLQFWEFHDLLFHSRSRKGEFDDCTCFGATYRFKKHLPPPKISKVFEVNHEITLHKPDLNALETADSSFTKILETRRSIRNFNEIKKIDIKTLGEFLYRSLATREVIKTLDQDAIYKPYPSAGAIHEIDFYLVVYACEGLIPDIYYYNPINHSLFKKNVAAEYVDKIISITKVSMGPCANTPHIVFVLTSHFKKIAWKYEKMSYRSTLISMGTIFQTMSLVATSMGLASCIIGAGDSSIFAEATKIISLEEGAIGEFVLGLPANQVD